MAGRMGRPPAIAAPLDSIHCINCDNIKVVDWFSYRGAELPLHDPHKIKIRQNEKHLFVRCAAGKPLPTQRLRGMRNHEGGYGTASGCASWSRA